MALILQHQNGFLSTPWDVDTSGRGPIIEKTVGMGFMKRALLLLLLIALTAEGLYLLDSSGYAQERGTRYFPETSHNLQGSFFHYFQEKGGLEIFGYPITEVFQEDGLLVQYFQRARLVLTGSRGKRASGSGEVKVAPLGELLGHRSPSFKPTYHFSYRYYPKPGHALSFAFLDYYQARGGVEVFGYPITEPFLERGLIVQYFQRARMEWHPDKKRVQLGLLGEEYSEARGLDPALRAPVEPIVEETTPIPLFQGSERGYMRVRDTKGEGLQLREGPGFAFATVHLLPEEALVKVMGGPVEADGYRWWQLTYEGLEGWSAGAWLQPLGEGETPP